MFGLLNNWFGRPLTGTLVVFAIASGLCVLWRQFRDRARRRDYLQRQRERREYWGFD